MMINHLKVNIYLEDTDQGGIVYHSNYLKYAERGRTEFLRACGFDLRSLMKKEKVFFVVYKCQISFFLPAYLGDEIVVETSLKKISPVRLGFHHVIKKDKKKIVEAEIWIANIDDQNQKPVKIPSMVYEKLRNIVRS